MPGPGTPNPQPTNPTTLGPFTWNPITFSGNGVTGSMQVTLFSNGTYSFSGSFNDPDFLDYDDSLAFVIVASNGVALSFSHSGTMHGWGDRWFEGGSATDSWNNTGTNASISENWAALCTGWRWQANAGTNVDIGDIISDVEALLKAVGEVVSIVIAIVA